MCKLGTSLLISSSFGIALINSIGMFGGNLKRFGQFIIVGCELEVGGNFFMIIIQSLEEDSLSGDDETELGFDQRVLAGIEN